MTTPVRRSSKSLLAERVGQLKRLAEQIDRDESPAIKARGRQVRSRHEALRDIVRLLKAERQRLGLSLAEVGERSGIGKANLSRLENDLDPNPTIDTLMRYADALNKEIRIDLSSQTARRRSA
jgi:DNA-binding XRE family transcriptional regulator